MDGALSKNTEERRWAGARGFEMSSPGVKGEDGRSTGRGSLYRWLRAPSDGLLANTNSNGGFVDGRATVLAATGLDVHTFVCGVFWLLNSLTLPKPV